MITAKDIIIKPINSKLARAVIKMYHYSGKVVQNSSLNFGVFVDGKCEGALQFGSPMDKKKSLNIIKGTAWNGMLELNRMAFSDKLPKFSESRAIGFCIRTIKKNYPHIEWIQSFADGAKCGDGTIYRASGFFLTQIKKNSSILEFPNGKIFNRISLETNWKSDKIKELCIEMNVKARPRTCTEWVSLGAKRIKGFQLRYIFFIDKSCVSRLNCDILPFSAINEKGAGMYLGNAREAGDGYTNSTAAEQHRPPRSKK